ncbi:MAG: histone deacetylase family protein [Desulfobacterales bacterium]
MKVVFHEEFCQVYTSDPAAEPGRMESIVAEIGPHVEFVAAAPAAEGEIAAVHTAEHIARVRQNGLYDIAALAAGGAAQAAAIGLSEPCFALVRPPGHHASAGSSWGFCYFNNMAVAIESLRQAGRIETAYILDFDLHYGDGTVNILEHRGYTGIHNPGAHERKAYLWEVAEELARCRADIIGVSAGFDNHRQDWGGLLMTEDYFEMGRMVREAARRNRAGCFAVLEGGYNPHVLGKNVLALINGMSV